MPEGRRPERVAEAVLRAVSESPMCDLRDPRLRGSTLTAVRVDDYLRHRRVYFSHREGSVRAPAAVVAHRVDGGFAARRGGRPSGQRRRARCRCPRPWPHWLTQGAPSFASCRTAGRGQGCSPERSVQHRSGASANGEMSLAQTLAPKSTWFSNSVWEPSLWKLRFLNEPNGRETEFRNSGFPNRVWEPGWNSKQKREAALVGLLPFPSQKYYLRLRRRFGAHVDF